MRKFGGSKLWNISVLNGERRGENLLLASLTLEWHSEPVRPLLRMDNIFVAYGYREPVRRLVMLLRGYLETDLARIFETREHRAKLVDALVEAFIDFTAALRSLPAGWSQHAECRLGDAEVLVWTRTACSSPMTWGLPAMTAFLGTMTALARRLGQDSGIRFEGVDLSELPNR